MRALGCMLQKYAGYCVRMTSRKSGLKRRLNKVVILYAREECRAALSLFPGRGRGVEMQGVTCPKWTVP